MASPVLLAAVLSLPLAPHAPVPLPELVRFASGDGLEITADLYAVEGSEERPFVVLFHQAGWSRGEYRTIAPRLNQLGLSCLAVDLRAGRQVEGVVNESARAARARGEEPTYLDALRDVVAALAWAREQHATDRELVVWGSSYSAALVLVVAAEHPELVDAVLAFSPGEYFGRLGKSKTWIREAAARVACPVFVTSARSEERAWREIFEAVPGANKVAHVPETEGNHGARALWERFEDHAAYWEAVEAFLRERVGGLEEEGASGR